MDHWFESAAEHLGQAYLRYSFTMGTDAEVEFLIGALGLESGMSVLDVGCGPGRHAHALAERGMQVVGIDISQRFVDLATANAPVGATFERRDARRLGYVDRFDAAISLCQGAFGLAGTVGAEPLMDPDGEILTAMARAVRPGGVVAVSAFSAYFLMRYLEDQDAFDAVSGVNHEIATLKNEVGTEIEHDLWTSCFTPRELRLMAKDARLDVRSISSVAPGKYGLDPPVTTTPEFLLIADVPRRR